MGGIGKTTIATVVFNRFCSDYEGCCFLANIREESDRYGIISLKNKIFSTLLKQNNLQISTPNEIPSYVKRRLHQKKVLLVLDDVNDSNQLENLVGALDCFGLRSRIIITIRDKQIFGKKVDEIYEVKPLIFKDAVELFMLNAFKQTFLDMDWTEISWRVINYAKGNPLALKVLGSFLCDKSKEEWESQLEKLNKMPHPKIQDVLRLSYDRLDHEEKNIFLHVACFFKGRRVEHIKNLLDSCGYSTIIGLQSLKDKSLLAISKEEVSMHDLTQEMSFEIVHEESIENPEKRSRLWNSNNICEVLKNNKGTKAIQSISLDISKIEKLSLSPQAFDKMHKLKFLKFFNNIFPRRTDWRGSVHLPQGLESFPKELRLLHWEDYPLKSLLSTFSGEKLVELVMIRSHVERLRDGVKHLVNLKKIDLRCSEYLLELPDFSEANNLEEVDLSGCTNLRLVHPSILSLPKLRSLGLSHCKNITSLQSAIPLKALWELRLCENMRELNLSSTAITELPSSIGSLSNLEDLIDNCRSLMNLPSQLVDPRSLRYLSIDGCIQLLSVTDLPPSLEELYAEDCISLETVQFSPMAADPHNQNMMYINFQNCLKLDEHLHRVIGAHAHLNLTNYAFKHLSPDEREKIAVDGVVIYPGSKVPDWFGYSTSQASITIIPHSELQGFIFCVILRRHPLPESYTRVGCYWFLKDSNGRSRRVPPGENDSSRPWKISFGKLISDHVLLWYDDVDCHYINERIQESRARNQLGTYPKVSFDFYALYRSRKGGKAAGMKECGVYPVYASERNKRCKRSKL